MNQVGSIENTGAVTSINGGGVCGSDYVDGFEWIGGWCSYYPLRTLEKIGGYDGNFPKPYYGVDIDHSYRIIQAGLDFKIIDYWVHHHQENDRAHDKDPQTEENKTKCAEYFRKKWGIGEKE